MELDLNMVRSLVTVAGFALFALIVWWAYSPSRRDEHEAVGRAILDDSNELRPSARERKDR